VRDQPPLVVLVLGGAAGRWGASASPLAVAPTPNLDRLAGAGRVLGVEMGEQVDSAAPLLALLGFDPAECETARSSFLGALVGESIASEECYLSADFVALFRDAVADVEPGPWRAPEVEILLRAAGEAMQRAGFRLVRVAGAHHLAVAPRASVDEAVRGVETVLGRSLTEIRPAQDQHAFAHRLGRQALDGHEINEVRRDLGHNGADMIWLSGPGGAARLGGSSGIDGPISAFGRDPVWRGICHVAGIEIKTPHAKSAAGLVRGVGKALANGDRLCFVYTRRATVDALRREPASRAAGLASLDEHLVGPLARTVEKCQGRLLVVSDTARDSETGAPLPGPVPALLWGAGVQALSRHPFTEAGASAAGDPIAPPHGLLPYLLRL